MFMFKICWNQLFLHSYVYFLINFCLILKFWCLKAIECCLSGRLHQNRTSIGSLSPSPKDRSFINAIALWSILIVRHFVVSKMGKSAVEKIHASTSFTNFTYGWNPSLWPHRKAFFCFFAKKKKKKQKQKQKEF